MLLPTLSNLKVILMGSRPWIRVLWLQWSRALWRKRDSTATVSRGERPDPCLDKLLLLFWHITLRMVLIYYAPVCFRGLQKTKEKMLLITSKRKDIYKWKGKSS